MSAVRIIILAKAPVPGRVKTRLVPALGAAGAAALARLMLAGTIAEALAAGIGPVEVCGDPGPGDPAWDDLLDAPALLRSAQGDGDLGARLARAAGRALAGGLPLILIGSDCPALDRQRLKELAELLLEHDAVIHPAVDGGYVALGLRRFDASLFEGIAWSTSKVARQTVARIERLGWSCAVAGPPLRDVDTPEDLEALGLAPSTGAIARPPG